MFYHDEKKAPTFDEALNIYKLSNYFFGVRMLPVLVGNV